MRYCRDSDAPLLNSVDHAVAVYEYLSERFVTNLRYYAP